MPSGGIQACDTWRMPVHTWQTAGRTEAVVRVFSSNLRLAHLEGLADIGARRGRVLRRRGRRLLGPSRVVGLVPSARQQVLDARVLVAEATRTGKGQCLVGSKSRRMAYRVAPGQGARQIE